MQHATCYTVGMPAYLYEIVHRASGKRYVGITEQAPSQRWHAHKCDARKGRGTRVARALAKHGAEAFDWSVLSEFPTRGAAAAAEIAAIRETRPAYSITAGGEGTLGARHSEASREKMRGPRPELAQKCRARAHTAAGRAHLDAIRYTGGRPGWVVTAETSARMSASAKDRVTEAFLTMNVGRIATPETRATLSKAGLEYAPGFACVICAGTSKRIRGFGKCTTCYAREYAYARRAKTRQGPPMKPEARANMVCAQQARRRRESSSG
jgi:hypothetical protein